MINRIGRGSLNRINKIKMILKAEDFSLSANPRSHIDPIKKFPLPSFMFLMSHFSFPRSR